MDLERSESEIQSLQAAGGNSRTARRLRVKSQLRDKKGRWVEMGRKASVDVKINGEKTKVQGRFVGSDPKAPGVRGLFLVEADEARGIKRGVYSFKGKAVNQILASLDPEYLEDQGIKDPNRDVNGNLNGFTLDEDIEELSEVDFEEVGELDEALATGKLSADEVSQAFNERARAGAHESYNVVANLEEADTEVLTEEQLDEILEDVGVTPETPEAPKAPETSAPKVEDLPRQIGRDARIPDDRVPDSKPPVATFKTANRLAPGDIVKMPDGTTRKVVRNNSVDSGSLVSFEPRDGERRGTYKTYSDDDLVEIEQPTQEVKAEIPAPPTPPTTPTPEESADESRSFEQVKEAFENPSEKQSEKSAEQRDVQHWYVDESGNVYPDRDDKPAPPAELISPENERFWDRESNKVFDGNGNEIVFSPTFDEKFSPIPQDKSETPRPMGESGFWDRNQLGVENVDDSPIFVKTDDPEEIVNALARGRFVKTETLKAAYDAIKLAITAKYAPRAGEAPSKEERDSLKQALSLVNSGQRYQLTRAIDVDSLNKQDTTILDRELRRSISESGTLSPGVMATLHEAFRNQPIDLTNLQANGSNAYSQNNAGAIREEMPPLASFNRPIFETELERLGINFTNEEMQADDMKPLQAEMSMDNVAGLVQAMEDGVDLWKGGKSRIYVDRDGNILDGHHRWAAVVALQWKDGESRAIPVTRIDLPRDEALTLMNEWANSRGIPGQKLVDNRMGIEVPITPAQAPETGVPEIADLQWDQERVNQTLNWVKERVRSLLRYDSSGVSFDLDGLASGTSDDPDIKEAIDMVYYMSDIIERTTTEAVAEGRVGERTALYTRLQDSIAKTLVDKAKLRPASIPPRAPGRAETVREKTARSKDGGLTVDPITLTKPRVGIAVAVEGFSEEIADNIFFDAKLGDLAVADYVDRNKDKFAGGRYKLGVWHDKDNNEVVLDLIELFPDAQAEEAEKAGKDRNQQGIFDLRTKKFIPTEGTGDRGRARREREAQRQAGDRNRSRPELERPDAIGEGGEGQTPQASDAGGDGSGREQLAFETPRALKSINIEDRAKLSYPQDEIDLSLLNTKQRQLIKKFKDVRNRMANNLLKAAKERDVAKYERALTWATALNDSFKRVFGEIRNSQDVTFGSGEKERLKNMTFFSNTLQKNEATGQITRLEGIYVNKAGKPFALIYNGYSAQVHDIGPDGQPSNLAARVDMNWTGESERGPQQDRRAVSISMLATEQQYKSSGLAGAAVTFARYLATSSGRHFVHSSSLTPPGANNSKAIEPGDPTRHNYSQSEKVLHLMGAPTMKLMEKKGWFTEAHEWFVAERWRSKFNPTNFTLPLDVTGGRNDGGKMIGPLYVMDQNINSFLNAYILAARKKGEGFVHSDFIKPYTEVFGTRNAGEFMLDNEKTLNLQFLFEDLNWKDGPSKEAVVKKLKDYEEFVESTKSLFTETQDPNPSNRGSIDLGGEEGNKKLDILISNLRELREGLEEDPDFDSKRLDRPAPLDISIPKQVELKFNDGSVKDDVPFVFERVPGAYGIANFSSPYLPPGIVARLSQQEHMDMFGRAPKGWTNDPGRLALKFSLDQLKDSFENALGRINGERGRGEENAVYGELDFRREFALEPETGRVTLAALVRAMHFKMNEPNGATLREYIAEQVDRAYGTEDNIKKLDKETQKEREFYQMMDEYLAEVGETRDTSAEDQIQSLVPGAAEAEKAESDSLGYDKTDETLRSETFLSVEKKSEITNFIEINSLQENEKFDELPNELGEILSEPAPELSREERTKLWDVARFNVYTAQAQASKGLAEALAFRYKTEDILEAFKDALTKGYTTVRVQVRPERDSANFREAELDIRFIRDTLQYLNVDTNGFIRSQVIPNLNAQLFTDEEIIELNRNGRMPQKNVQQILNEANEVVDFTSFRRITDLRGGSSALAGLYEDSITGKRYAVKLYDSNTDQGLAEMEIATQAFYRAAGIYASNPRFAKNGRDPGEIYVITDFVPENSAGNRYSYVMSGIRGEDKRAAIAKAIRNGLAMDMLLDNLDGPFNSGNVIIDKNFAPIRIDGGGGLIFDALSGMGEKQDSPRYDEMTPLGYGDMELDGTPEQKKLLEILKKDGSFEGNGIEAAYDFYLNDRSGLHWNNGASQRSPVLEGFEEDVFKESVKELLYDMTPRKITSLVDGMPMQPEYKDRVKEALIYRRAHMLAHFGIDDNVVPEEVYLGETVASQADYARLARYITDVYGTTIGDPKRTSFELLYINNNSSKLSVENAIEELKTLKAQKKSEPSEEEQPEVETPSVDPDAIAEVLNNQETSPDNADLPTTTLPEFLSGSPELSSVKPDDIIDNSPDTTYNGRVIFNVRDTSGSKNKYSIGIKNDSGKVRVFSYEPSQGVKFVSVRRYREDQEVPETSFGPNLKATRDRYLANLKTRSNQVLNDVKAKYTNTTQLSNGDLVVSSRVYTTAARKSYLYQVVVHRKEDEEFVTYVRETELGLDGAPISAPRVNKMSTPTHSAKALLNKIAPLIQGSTVGRGVYGRDPRNWFNQGNSIQSEVADPRTGMLLPKSLVSDESAQYIENTGIRSTGDPAKDAIISYVNTLVSRGEPYSDIYRSLADNGILSRSNVGDIIERIEATRAFPGINQIPYLSRNKRDIIRVGDRVRHYAPNGTIKEGVVRLRRPLSVNRKPNGDYNYTDVLVVKFDGIDQGTPIVAKNLEIISRADGNAPDLGAESVPSLPTKIDASTLPELPENWSATFDGDSFALLNGPDDAPMLSISRVKDAYRGNVTRFIVYEYPSIEEGRNSRTLPRRTLRFANLPSAALTAENIIKNYEEQKLEKGEESKPGSEGSKLFSAEDLTSDEISNAIEKNIGDSPCAITAAATEVCDITGGLEYERKEGSTTRKNERDKEVSVDYVEISFDNVPNVDKSVLPVYRIEKTSFLGRARNTITYWLNPADVGNYEKGKTFKVPNGKTIDEAIELIRKNAEKRIEFVEGLPEGKNTRTLNLGNLEPKELSFEDYFVLSVSPISKSHFSLGSKGDVIMSPERLAYYQQQVDFHLSGIEPNKNRDPIIYFLGGTPASGKGSFTKKNSDLSKLSTLGGTPQVKSFNELTGLENTSDDVKPDAVVIDPDTFKIRFPETRERHIRQVIKRILEAVKDDFDFARNRVGKDDDWAADSHEESSLMAKVVLAEALNKKLDVVVDKVNAEKSKVVKEAEKAKGLGYKVIGKFLEAPFSTTSPTANERSFTTGRIVPFKVQTEAYLNLTESLSDNPESDRARIWEAFDEFELFSRDANFNFTKIGNYSSTKNNKKFTFDGATEAERRNAQTTHLNYINLGMDVEGGAITTEQREEFIAEERRKSLRQRKLLEKRQALMKAKVPLDKILNKEDEAVVKHFEEIIKEIELEALAIKEYIADTYKGVKDKEAYRMLLAELSNANFDEKAFKAVLSSWVDRVKSRGTTYKQAYSSAF